jgi:hypothetical protein
MMHCDCNELCINKPLFSKEAKVVKQVTVGKHGSGQSAIVADEEAAVASSDGSSTTAT